MDEDAIVARGVDLLAHLEHGELDLAAAMDRIELVTQEPRLQERILRVAEAEGVIEREGATIRPASGAFLRFQSDVTRKEGEFTCRRCGAALTEGYFVCFETGELGPFGSSCIRTVMGRD